jgi:hypothetical protein
VLIVKKCHATGVGLLAVTMIVSWRIASATTPPRPRPLDERVQMASHIFVGVAEDVWIVYRNGDKVEPQPQVTDLGQLIEMSVRVDEVLYPGDWRTNASVRVLYGADFFGTSDTHKQFVGKKLIYLTVQRNGQNTNFVASYGWSLTEPLDKRNEIETLIRRNAKAQP